MRMHCAKGAGGVRCEQNLLQVVPELDASRRIFLETGHDLLDLMFGGRAEAEAVPRHKPEHAQRQFRIAERFGTVQKNPAIHDREFGVRKPRPQILKLPVKRRPRGGKFLQQLGRDAMNQARMLKVDAHPLRSGKDFAAADSDSLLGGFILGVPGECIVVARMAEMQKAARRHQKIERVVERLLQRRRQERACFGPGTGFFDRGNQRQPTSQIVIAQAARAVFDVRFEMKYGVAEFVVARAAEIGKPLHDLARLARYELGNQIIMKSFENGRIARKITAIEQRDRELDIVCIKAVAFGQQYGWRG